MKLNESVNIALDKIRLETHKRRRFACLSVICFLPTLGCNTGFWEAVISCCDAPSDNSEYSGCWPNSLDSEQEIYLEKIIDLLGDIKMAKGEFLKLSIESQEKIISNQKNDVIKILDLAKNDNRFTKGRRTRGYLDAFESAIQSIKISVELGKYKSEFAKNYMLFKPLVPEEKETPLLSASAPDPDIALPPSYSPKGKAV